VRSHGAALGFNKQYAECEGGVINLTDAGPRQHNQYLRGIGHPQLVACTTVRVSDGQSFVTRCEVKWRRK